MCRHFLKFLGCIKSDSNYEKMDTSSDVSTAENNAWIFNKSIQIKER